MNYWKECIAEALSEAEINATPEQINLIALCVEGAHENYGMAHGHDCIPSPLQSENDKLRRDLEREREKEICPECKGEGRLVTPGPYHSSDSACWECNGSGFLYRRP